MALESSPAGGCRLGATDRAAGPNTPHPSVLRVGSRAPPEFGGASRFPRECYSLLAPEFGGRGREWGLTRERRRSVFSFFDNLAALEDHRWGPSERPG